MAFQLTLKAKNNKFGRLIKVVGSCLFALMISSCSHRTKDGPPSYHVDVSKIPNAVPKPEKRAKLGNMPSYRVFGKRYHVLSSSKHYDKIGTASWYGTKFHNRKTSSGEPYNMLAMTAAHKTLPLPTYVEVTNLKNKRKIIVKVNDRGPFASNRIIDLSYVAAKKLGMLGGGTTKVRVRAINPYTFGKTKAPVESARFGNQLYLQAGAFKEKHRAIQFQNQLQAITHSPVHIATPTFYNGNYYRVRIGPIHDEKTVQHLQQRLSTKGIKARKISL